MKMLAEYLENAIKFEKLAAEEKDAKLKEHFEKQGLALSETSRKKSNKLRPPSSEPARTSVSDRRLASPQPNRSAKISRRERCPAL
jgi:hypothetical protein